MCYKYAITSPLWEEKIGFAKLDDFISCQSATPSDKAKKKKESWIVVQEQAMHINEEMQEYYIQLRLF